jgi:hypothetical protein
VIENGNDRESKLARDGSVYRGERRRMKRSAPIPFFFSSLAFLLNGASILRLLLRNAIETAAHVFAFSLSFHTQVRVEIRDYGRGSHG